jgi:branched-chain amino acid aminotransferase
MAIPNYAYFNGRVVPYGEAKVGVLTHALNYGTSVFGGLRGYWNKDEKQLFIFRPYDHFRRFINSSRLLRMDLGVTEEDLVSGLLDLIRTEDYHEDCYIRPLAFYGDELIGVRLHNLTPVLSMAAVPFGSYLEHEEGAHVGVSSWRRVEDGSIPARGKIGGSYVNSAFAKTDAQLAGFDEAIVLNAAGHVSEASAANFFLVRNGVVITPPITEDILEGITRATVMTLLREEFGLTVVEREIDRTELYLADEAFFTGTGVQIAAITRIDHRPVGDGKMGSIVSELRDMFFSVVRGEVQKYRHWCMPVYEPVKVANASEALKL